MRPETGAGGRADRRIGESVARPTVLGDVGVGDTPLQATLWPVVHLVPEANGAFDDLVDVAVAGASASGTCRRCRWGERSRRIDRKAFRRAARVVEER